MGVSVYSTNFAPSDFFLFPNMKKWLAGKRFELNDDVITETEAYFGELLKYCFLDDFKKWENRWGKCIELQGDYVGK